MTNQPPLSSFSLLFQRRLVLRDEAVGFFCLDRQPSANSFAPEDVEFLSLLGRLATALIGGGTPGRKREQQAGDADAVLEWPMAMVGKCPKMQEVYRQIEDAATTDGNVLLIGETGTGKELVAQAIHQQSSCSKGPFIQMNCGAIPETLTESEFFGYVARSGVAGADPNGAPGKFELAHGGALLLDEIEAMSLAIQAKCLRVLEEKKVWRLGARAPVSVAVKVIAATNEDLGQAVDSGRFRKDLFFRFGQQIRVPPLRERQDDIPLLAHYFLDKYARQDRKRTRGLSHI
jgi:transcriptional regulator with PAS, ATPase and Fis domain